MLFSSCSHTFYIPTCNSTGSSTGRMAASLSRFQDSFGIPPNDMRDFQWKKASHSGPDPLRSSLWICLHRLGLAGVCYTLPSSWYRGVMWLTLMIKPVLVTHSHFIYCWTVSAHHQDLSCFSLCSHSEDVRNRFFFFFFFKFLHCFLDPIPFLSISLSFYQSSSAELGQK